MHPRVKGKETSSKGRQAQLVQGFQHMVQTLTRPRETEEGLTGAVIEGMVEVQAEGEGDVPWCGENPQEDPVKGATQLKGKGSGAAIGTSATRTKSPRGRKRKEVSKESNSTPKKSKEAIEENLGEETPMQAHKNRKGKLPQEETGYRYNRSAGRGTTEKRTKGSKVSEGEFTKSRREPTPDREKHVEF